MLQKNLSWKPGLWSLKFQRGKYQKKNEGISYKSYLNFLTETAFFGQVFQKGLQLPRFPGGAPRAPGLLFRIRQRLLGSLKVKMLMHLGAAIQ